MNTWSNVFSVNGQLQRVGLKHADAIESTLTNFSPGFSQHPIGQVDPDDSRHAILRIIVQRHARPNAHVQHQVFTLNVHVSDRLSDSPSHQSTEGGVIKTRMNIVNLLGAGFLHSGQTFDCRGDGLSDNDPHRSISPTVVIFVGFANQHKTMSAAFSWITDALEHSNFSQGTGTPRW